MSVVAQHVVTAEELWLLPMADGRRELVRGEVIEHMPPGGRHGAIAVILAMLLQMWAQRSGGGYVGVEAGYILSRHPDTVRGPDVSYIRADRLPASGIPEGFWTLAPDLAVEIVSPSETADDVRAKVRDFLQAGTPLVWTVYARTHEVIVHTADGASRLYDGNHDCCRCGDLPAARHPKRINEEVVRRLAEQGYTALSWPPITLTTRPTLVLL